MTVARMEPHGLAESIDYAEKLACAGLLPDAFKRKPADVLVALDIANSLHESPWTVMSEMSIISGKPSFSAKFMRSRVRQAGHRLRETFENGLARAVIVRADDPDFEHVAEWDEAKARQHDLWGKGHWRKNPELMLRNRALSEVVRSACYEVMGGIGYTPDEVQDFTPVATVTATQVDAPAPTMSLADAIAADEKPAVDWLARIGHCDSVDELRALWKQAKAAGADADTLDAIGTAASERQASEALSAIGEPVDDETGEVYDAEVLS